uniref:BAR domain-containing protein n=1 Tax=Heterorhabditis bacteriophora TaxID=37862 RepID=A0A1I7XMU9_HETBA
MNLALYILAYQMTEDKHMVTPVTAVAHTLCRIDLKHKNLCLDNLAHAMCEVTQENPKHRTSDYLQMEIDSPPGEDQYEKVAFYLRNNKTFENYKKCKIHIEVYDKMAAEHREYVRRARCLLKNIRAFIKHDYLVIDIHRGELDQRRREMDFAKSELKAAKELQLIEVKSQQYNQAVQTFEEKLNEVTTMLDLLPKNKEAHINDLLEWTIHTRQHHEKMAKLLDLTEK